MSKQKYSTTGKRKIKAPGVLVSMPKRRFPAPMAVFPVSVPGSSAVLDAIKQIFFKENPEEFSFRMYRVPRVGEIPYSPLPDFISPPDSVVVPAPRKYFVGENPYKLPV